MSDQEPRETEWGFLCRVEGCPNDSQEDSYYCKEHEGTQKDD